MPWSLASAVKHTKKATTPKAKKQWTDTANAVLKKTGNDATAIKIANAAVRKSANKSKINTNKSKKIAK